MNATPRPWAATSNGEIIGADTNEVAITKNWGNEELCNANAELIVRAVNSYDAMLEALEAIKNHWEEGDARTPLFPSALLSESDTLTIFQQVKVALALAKGDRP